MHQTFHNFMVNVPLTIGAYPIVGRMVDAHRLRRLPVKLASPH